MLEREEIKNTRVIKIALIGFGNSARRLAELLIEKEEEIFSQYKVKIVCTSIATARHGKIVSSTGIDLKQALDCVKSDGLLASLKHSDLVEDTFQAIDKSSADIVVETTLLNPQNGEPALSHIKQALLNSKSVVTANKGPLAFASKELLEIAKNNDCFLRYESTVMDGTPIFNLAKYTLPLVKVRRIKGIVNSTTNFILTEMEAGRDFADALIEAQNRGIAEADASLDIDGWDAAVKATVLANCLMAANIKPTDVLREGISKIQPTQLLNAVKAGKKVRLVMDVELTVLGVQAKVLPMEISKEDIFYNIDAFSNILSLETDLMGTLMIVEQSPTLTQTAYGLLSDILDIIRNYQK